MGPLMELAKRYNLYIVEDCAEALGSSYNGKKVGSFGHVGTFSFFGNKTITTGEGGMVTFQDKALYEKAAILRDHGMSPKKRYWNEVVGFNYRLTNLQAAIGVAQMERIDEFIDRKLKLADFYNKVFESIPGIQIPANLPGRFNTYWLYTVLISDKHLSRDELIEKLLLCGIETRRVFYPLHDMPIYQKFVLPGQEFPTSTHIGNYGISLPSSLTLTADDLYEISRKICSIFQVKDLYAL
jgi:perosamine synthetase